MMSSLVRCAHYAPQVQNVDGKAAMVVISRDAFSKMLEKMEHDFQATIGPALTKANQRRAKAGLNSLTREQAEKALRIMQGGDPVATLMSVEIGVGGALTLGVPIPENAGRSR